MKNTNTSRSFCNDGEVKDCYEFCFVILFLGNKNSMKKVIVTGHNGFIGPHLVRLLKEAGYYVIGIDTNYFDESCKFSNYEKPDEEIIKFKDPHYWLEYFP